MIRRISHRAMPRNIRTVRR